MNLFILRHASAGIRRNNPLLDVKRPLDKDGKRYCLQLAQVLNAMKLQFDLIVSSPLKRCTQTASLVGNELGYEGKLQLDTGLRPEAGLPDFRKILEKYARLEALMVVGHNPNLSQFLGSVISDSGCEASLELKKGGVAKVEMRRSSGTLQWCLTPKALRNLYAAAVESSRPNTSRK